MSNFVCFDSVTFDKAAKTMTILKGTVGTYDYRKIIKCSILNEEAKFKGKTEPFLHQVLGGTTFYSMLGEPMLYVGIKLILDDKTVLAIYVSDTKTMINTELYNKDKTEAEKIKHFIDSVIKKYQKKNPE